MHPVTAHGFNLGLASAQRLAQGIVAQQRRGADIAAAGMLASYQRGHRLASRPLYEATNAIASLYTDDRRRRACCVRPACAWRRAWHRSGS
jgi:2-polyprenyl-6-methoxyphenol hydroxylase-like FAD-dependent oxidoreductase